VISSSSRNSFHDGATAETANVVRAQAIPETQLSKAWCPRRRTKFRIQCENEVTARTQWSAHTRITL